MNASSIRVALGAVAAAASFALVHMALGAVGSAPPASTPRPVNVVEDHVPRAATLVPVSADDSMGIEGREATTSASAARTKALRAGTSTDTAPAGRGDAAKDPELAELGTVIYGVARDSSKLPLRFVDLELSRIGRVESGAEGSAKRTSERRRTRTDGQGRFSLGPMPAGSGELIARGRNYRPTRVALDWSDGPPLLRKDIAVDLRRQVEVFYSVQGHADPAAALLPHVRRTNIPEVLAVATASKPGAVHVERVESGKEPVGMGLFSRRSSETTEAPDGTARLGSLSLTGDGARWVSICAYSVVLGCAELAPDATSVEIELDLGRLTAARGSITLEVVDGETDEPVVGAEVLWTEYAFPNGRADGTSDRDGRVSMSAQLPGERWLWVSADGYDDRGERLKLDPGADLVLATVTLWKPTRAAGRVTNPRAFDGEVRVENGIVVSATGEVHWTSFVVLPDAHTGEFSLQRGRGDFAIRAVIRGDGHHLDAVSEIIRYDGTGQRADPLLLTLCSPGRLTVSPPAPASRPEVVEVRDAAGLIVASSRIYGDEDLLFDLAPAHYECERRPRGGKGTSSAVRLTERGVRLKD